MDVTPVIEEIDYDRDGLPRRTQLGGPNPIVSTVQYLRPEPRVNRAIAYCLARASELFGVRVHAQVWMSNHCHLVVTDVRGNLPEFAQWLFRTIALCIKTLRPGIAENVWAVGSYSAVRLETEEAILDKMAYVLANPATARLVRTGREWPGVISRPEDLYGHEREHPRPDAWFRESQVEVAKMAITVPPCFQGQEERVIEWLAREVADRERAVARELREDGSRPLGVEGVLTNDVLDATEEQRAARPSRPALGGDHPRRDPGRSREPERLATCVRRGLAGVGEGAYETVFPAGTWWVVRYASATAAPL